MQLQGGCHKGFTLIELISIVVLLSILGVAAFSRLGNMNEFKSAGFYYDTVSALRYAQKLAISTGCVVEVKISTNRYELYQGDPGCNDTTYTLPVLNPANRSQNYQATAPNGLSFTSSASLPVSIRFTPESMLNTPNTDTSFTIAGRTLTVFHSSGLVDAQ
jgi:MSHA pilin protein MshC